MLMEKEKKPKPKPKPCPYCGGKGKVTRVVYVDDNVEYVTEQCCACLGTGKAM